MDCLLDKKIFSFMPLNLTCVHCLQRLFFGHLFNLYCNINVQEKYTNCAHLFLKGSFDVHQSSHDYLYRALYCCAHSYQDSFSFGHFHRIIV